MAKPADSVRRNFLKGALIAASSPTVVLAPSAFDPLMAATSTSGGHNDLLRQPSPGADLSFPTKEEATAATIPAAEHKLVLQAEAYPGDGLGGQWVDFDTGTANTFTSNGGARTWYQVADVSASRLNGPESIRSLLGTAPSVATRAALKTVSTTKETAAILMEAGREGLFGWRDGDFSSQVAADPFEGIYIAADSVDASSGAWVRQYSGLVSLGWFNPAGDGIADDTAVWGSFEAMSGAKFVPVGRYLVNGSVHRFDVGVIGNGVFDDRAGYWTQVQGDRERDAFIVHGREINANTTPLSPAIRTQTRIHYNLLDPSSATNFTRVADTYHEAVTEGINTAPSDNLTGNFTTLAATAHNKVAGRFGMTAISGRVWDAKESEVPDVNIYGASVNCAGYFPFQRRSKYVNGGYMIGLETYCFNLADETDAVPYQNSDIFKFTSWTAGWHCTGYGVGAPITAGVLMDGHSAAKHGFWNGIVIGGSAMKINKIPGVAGTVGLNFASWRTGSYGDVAIKFGKANRHQYYKEGALIRSSLTRHMYEAGACGVAIEGQTGTQQYLSFRTGNTDAPDPTYADLGGIRAAASTMQLRSVAGEVQLHPLDGAAVYKANSARFCPDSDGTLDSGGPYNRWNTVYASTGAINTSDAREKMDIRDILAQEKAVATRIKGLLKAFRFTDAVALKGEKARIHFGVIAQDVADAFTAEGLDPARYALFCYDEWEATPETVQVDKVLIKPAIYEQVMVRSEIDDDNGTSSALNEHPEVQAAANIYEDGAIIEPAEYEEIRSVSRSIEAGNRYGIRYEELLAFVISAL